MDLRCLRPAALLLLLCLVSQGALGQVTQRSYITWDEFVAEYLRPDEEQEPDEERISRLEELAQRPLQINRITREELLALPFLSEAQADSILSYRARKRGFFELGELQLVKNIDYFTRAGLSLFLRCDSTVLPTAADVERRRQRLRVGPKLWRGNHEVETTAEVPLYRRQGYRTPEEPTATNYYLGNGVRHVLRYRYAYRREVAYGLTMEKDAGEPVCRRGFYPYDYISGYVWLRPEDKRWSVAVGDYNVAGEQGLVFGRQYMGGKDAYGRYVKMPRTAFRPHTSTHEADYFRGLAAGYARGRWSALAFASYRRLDGRMSEGGDTVLSFPETGLHRTVAETARRRRVGTLAAGYHVACAGRRWRVALSGSVTHYDRTVCPEWHEYNRYYFRGRTAATQSLSYFYHFRSLYLAGETALDHGGHAATINRLEFAPSVRLRAGVQLRAFSPGFVTQYGAAQGQGSRVANEQGALVTVRCLPLDRWELTGYADFFRFPRVTYTSVLPGSNGMELSLRSVLSLSNRWKWSVQYRLKSKQQTVTGYEAVEYRMRHRVRTAVGYTSERLSLHVQADLTHAARQTGRTSTGWMCSARTAWTLPGRFGLKAFLAAFFTDDAESAVYAYEPQLYRSFSFPTFTYHGMRGVCQATLRVLPQLTLCARFGSTHYFNRRSQSSGTQLIASSWKNDLAVQLRWKF